MSGEYRLRYDSAADKDGWISITRYGYQGGIGTKLANGDFLDVTAAQSSLQKLYSWPTPRKDSRMFKSLTSKATPDRIELTIQSERRWARFDCKITAFKAYPGLLHWTVKATAKEDKAFFGKVEPDCNFIAGNDGSNTFSGVISHDVVRYSVQRGPGAPHVFFRDLPMKSYVFYFEDLSSLNDLYRLTGCAVPFDYPASGNPGAVRMGEPQHWFQMSSPDGTNNVQPMKPWEEKTERYTNFGYERPSSFRVPQGKSLLLADTYLYLKPAPVTDTISVSKNFCEMLGDIFHFIYKPPPITTDWAGEIVPRLVKDVMRPENTACLQGKYLLPKAYVSGDREDHQLWTLLQLLEPLELYIKNCPEEPAAIKLRNRLNEALPAYFDKQWGGFHNGPAPINQDAFFTSVYIFSPLIMVADLARLGNTNANRMLFGFRDRLLQMGKACDYVMADVWLRDFSKQRGYYQGDSTGCYIYAMMALYELSGGKDVECLEAAKAAAAKLRERCLDLGWEVNMTAAGVVGCEQLYRATGNASYHELAYIPLAAVMREAWLWECDFGIGEHITTFWAFCGCPGAPCSAEFEASRARVCLKDFAAFTTGTISSNLTAMLNDAWQRGPTQSRSALPPLLIKAGAKRFMPREGKTETDCGEIRYDQMIPLEDFRAGWGTDLEWWQNNAKPGVVGQEIYGAGGPIWYAVWQEELNPKR